MNDKLNAFGFLRVSASSPEIRIANIDFNVNKIIETLNELHNQDVQIALFPELSLTGYYCQDLFFQGSLNKGVSSGILKLLDFSKTISRMVIIVGAPIEFKQRLFNTSFVIKDGKVLGIVPKTYLPNTNEYYEKRWFDSAFSVDENYINFLGMDVPFGADLIFESIEIPNCRFGIEICHDLWNVIPPSSEMALAGALIIFNPSSSDEYFSKWNYRRSLVSSQSARVNCAYVYAGSGLWESTTDLVFSGNCIIAENGKILAEGRDFSFKGLSIISDVDLELLLSQRLKNDAFRDTPRGKKFRTIFIENFESDASVLSLKREISPTPFIPRNQEDRRSAASEIFTLQSVGLLRRLKHIESKDVVLGISGGLDSTLSLLVTINAFRLIELPLDGIHPIIMPGFGTSKKTYSNALQLVKKFFLPYEIIDIKPAVLQHFKDINHDQNKIDLVYENAQARERTQILMDLATKYNGIVVGTADLSEIALGWSTYNADHMSMYNVNAGVPKTLVRFIIEWFAESYLAEICNVLKLKTRPLEIKKVLSDILSTPISPELIPPKNQKITQKSEEIVGPFELNDFFLYFFFRYGFSPKKIFYMAQLSFANKYSPDEIKMWLKNFYKRFFVHQFKRSCSPDGPKVGTVALSPRGDWRMPSDADFTLWLAQLDCL